MRVTKTTPRRLKRKHSQVDHHEEDIGSKFDPQEIWGEDVDLDEIDGRCCPHCQRFFTNMPCPRNVKSYHTNAIIVAVDGACRGNGFPGAQSSHGIFFAPQSPYNRSVLHTDTNPTSQKAELRACLQALGLVADVQRGFVKGGPPIERVVGPLGRLVIKADSAYLLNSMTDFITKWRMNGYRTSKGTIVVNHEIFAQIDREVRILEALGVKVAFWHVPRERNQNADSLANAAFD
ncbi:MAG: hypothetical protein Q9212_005276 [Teloschistes hypoglaucus]